MKRFRSALLEKIAPKQIKGKESLTISHRLLNSDKYAASLFHEVHQRLLDVNHWQRYAGRATAHFQLTDKSGTEVHRMVHEGDFFQIDIPGPGSAAGGGADWVEVRKVGHLTEGDEEIAFIVVKTATNPLAIDDSTAHFFNCDASSTFFVHKKGLLITTGVLGRNETPNIQAASLKDRLRNILVAIGAMGGLSSAQWKALTAGWLSHSIDFL
jgi:hypothetical protein